MTVGGELRKVFQGVVEKVGQSSGVLLVTFLLLCTFKQYYKECIQSIQDYFQLFFEGGGRGSVN